MVDTQSKEVIDKMSDELKIQPSMALPRTLVNNIQPTFEVGLDRINTEVRSATTVTTGSTTIFTTPTGRNFFLTSAFLSMDDNATSDGTVCNLTVTMPSGAAANLIRLHKITLTATSKELSNSYPPKGILLARGSGIVMTHTFTVGASTLSAGITGYTTDPE